MSDEQWRAVVGYEGLYEVSDQGKVRALARTTPRGNHRKAWMLSPDDGPRGHLRVQLRDAEYEPRKIFVHVLVLTAFGTPRPWPEAECRHLDGDPTNNTIGNLRWGSRSENALDRVRHGNDAMARKTHCPQGHPYDAVNTYWHQPKNGKSPTRDCRTCRAAANRRAQLRRVS